MTDRPDRPPDGSHRIVVGVDGSADAQRAVRWAARQAVLTGAVLELHAAFGPGSTLVTPSRVDLALDRVLDEAVGEAVEAAPGVPTRRRTHPRTPQRALVDASEGADLVVVGSHGRGGFSGLLLGSVSRACLHRSHCPVVVLRHRETPETAAPGDWRWLVAGVDGSESATAGLAWAVHEAALTSSAVEAVAAWEWPFSYGVPYLFPAELDPASDSHAVLDSAFDTIAVPKGVPCRKVVIEGHPAPALIEASRGAELLVVGSRGHGAAGSALLGSVSEECVGRAHCPVLVMRGRSDGVPGAPPPAGADGLPRAGQRP